MAISDEIVLLSLLHTERARIVREDLNIGSCLKQGIVEPVGLNRTDVLAAPSLRGLAGRSRSSPNISVVAQTVSFNDMSILRSMISIMRQDHTEAATYE